MRLRGLGKGLRIITAIAIAATMLAAVSSGAGLAAAKYVVSQKGREFKPDIIAINRGEAITIVNDDADLRHHAYVDSDAFKFDSGDQEPGSKTDVAFPVAGTFDVLCAIHPKMKLTVTVK